MSHWNTRLVLKSLPCALLLLASCSSDDGAGGSSSKAASRPNVHAWVAHRDARVGNAPSFLWLDKASGIRFETARDAATVALQSLTTTFRLDARAFASVEALDLDDPGIGPVVAHFQQRDQKSGLEVFRGALAIAMTRSFDPVSASGFLAPSLAGAERPFVRSAEQAVRDAYASMNRGSLEFASAGNAEGGYEHFLAKGLAAPARVKKVLFPEAEGVVPAFYVEVQIARGPAFSFVVSATDGRILLRNDLVRADAFGYRVYADPDTKIPLDGPQGNAAAPYPAGKPNGYRPSFGAPSLVTLQNYPFSRSDPWLAANATTLSGNNVHAYADLHSPSGMFGDSDTLTSAPGVFDYSYDPLQSPGATPTNIAGAVTHLFYVTNFLHDWYYDVGFNEAARNHQEKNFGRGGVGSDPLVAEAQDYEGRNNANAMVPADGASPRLQMYVFSGPSSADITVLSPSSVAGTKRTAIAGFGVDTFDVTGTVALATDEQGADAADACEPITANLTGKIALVHRGLCAFTQKAQNVQAAGAIAAIVANVPTSAFPSDPPFMGGTSGSISIPVLSLSLPDGQALERALGQGAEVRLHRELATDLDGALDTTVVAHEWGHVMSGRLIGNGTGLTTNQAGGLGEGWADFSALLLEVRAEDLTSPAGAGWRGAYSNGAYATSGGGADFYFGIRRVPYSIDFAKNALTLKHIQNGSPLPANVPVAFGEDGSFNAEVHNTGEVWATMLWECYAALLRDSRYTFEQAQVRMKRYFVASLKLTPPDPTILEARDALLAAALASDEGDYRLFWEAFARRGAGVGAEGPPKDSATNQGVKESYDITSDVQISDATLKDDVISCDHDGILDSGEVGTISFSVRNSGPNPLTETTALLSSLTEGVTFADGGAVKVPRLEPLGKAVTVKARVQLQGLAAAAPVAIAIRVQDPTFGVGRVREETLTVQMQADASSESSATDRMDTRGTSWIPQTTGGGTKWERLQTGLDGQWAVRNGTVVSQQMLTSPPFTISDTEFELRFKHRFSFRISTRRKVDIDGGVVELSVDAGKTWKDASLFGKADYNTKLDTGGRGDNPLKGRAAYGNKSPGYPDQWMNSRMQFRLPEHPESVQLRFRAANGSGFSGAPGWEIDEVELVGITSKPFWSFVDHTDICDEKGPTVSAGASRVVGPKEVVNLAGTGHHPMDLPLTFTWTQVGGTRVALSQDGSARATFEAPDPPLPTTLTFELRANDGSLVSAGSRVDVTVLPTQWQAGGGGCSMAPETSATSSVFAGIACALALGLVGRRRNREHRSS